MNEIIFFLHILMVVIFLLLSLKLGKNYLLSLILMQAIIANIFVIKQINLFSKTVTCTDVFIIGIIFGENLLQEYFGKKQVLNVIKVSFFSMIFFLIMVYFLNTYLPSEHDVYHKSFLSIFKNSPRIMISSILVFFLVQRLDVIFFEFLRKIFNSKKLVLRMIISSITIQFLDTIFFSFLALRGIVKSLFDIILVSFLIKCLVILFSAVFMNLSKLIVKKKAI